MLRRTAATLATTAVLALGFMPAAGAQQEPKLDPYGAGASGVALYLSIADQQLTISGTGAAVTSAPEAAAEGQALVTPLLESDGAPVQSTGERVEGIDETPLSLPAPLDLLDAGIVRVVTSAEVVDGVPTATSTSDDIVIDIISAELVGDLSEALLRPVLEQVLAPITGPLGELGLQLDFVVNALLNDLETGATLARITVGSTQSAATKVVGAASSDVATVTLLPDLLPIGIVVAPSSANATYDAAADEIVLNGTASLAELEIGGLQLLLSGALSGIGDLVLGELPDPLGELLQGIFGQLLSVVGGLEDDLNEIVSDLTTVLANDILSCEGPLAALVCIVGGRALELDAEGLARYGFDYGEGTRGIEAQALSVDVLDGTIDLRLGQVAAAANGELAAPPQAPPTTAPPADAPPALPRTGADSAMPLALGLFAVAGIGVALLRRTRTV